ncbi:hypothetical protein PEDI_36520 [Persicobacter diffluens]|uniref:Uncharacterized protein n=1 Tax=Persicobacter diffluens TaxID=981 RepID=A0AAN5AKQ7_9BACT|nr:hypothetical protein PEDI_36520 [Persicobacter diffluens]
MLYSSHSFGSRFTLDYTSLVLVILYNGYMHNLG